MRLDFVQFNNKKTVSCLLTPESYKLKTPLPPSLKEGTEKHTIFVLIFRKEKNPSEFL